MKAKLTRKRWTKTEWLLLLAPLVIVVGIGAMNFAPQLGRAWREWREYGSNRPYAVFYPQTRDVKGGVTFYPVIFSPDAKHIVACEYELAAVKNSRVNIWNFNSREQISSWVLSGARPRIESLQFVLPDNLVANILDSPPQSASLYYAEKRSIKNGRLISTKKLQNISYRNESALFHFVSAFSSFKGNEPQRVKLGDTKNSINSIKVFTVKQLLNVDSSFMTNEDKKFVVQWMAQVYDAQGQKLYKPFQLLKYYDRSSSPGSSGSSMQFKVSPDGKTLLINPRTTDFFATDFFGKEIRQGMSEWLQAFDTTTGRSLWKRVLTQRGTQNDALNAGAFSPNSDMTALLLRKYKAGIFQTNLLELRDTRTGDILRHLNTYSSGQSTLAAWYTQFSPNGKLLAVPQHDRLELWDVSDLN